MFNLLLHVFIKSDKNLSETNKIVIGGGFTANHITFQPFLFGPEGIWTNKFEGHRRRFIMGRAFRVINSSVFNLISWNDFAWVVWKFGSEIYFKTANFSRKACVWIQDSSAGNHGGLTLKLEKNWAKEFNVRIGYLVCVIIWGGILISSMLI